jgi:hypothetical protein
MPWAASISALRADAFHVLYGIRLSFQVWHVCIIDWKLRFEIEVNKINLGLNTLYHS